jgi:hypothetical protein
MTDKQNDPGQTGGLASIPSGFACRVRDGVRFGALLAAVLFTSCSRNEPAANSPAAALTDEQRAETIIAVETAIQEVTPLLSALGRSLMAKPDDPVPAALRGPVLVEHPLADAAPAFAAAGIAEACDWPAADGAKEMPLPPWPGVRAMMTSWEAPKFGVLRGEFTERTKGDLILETKFEAGGADGEGRRCGIKASQLITWRKDAAGRWAIAGWKHKSLRVLRVKHPLFEEVLDSALPDADARELARRSPQEEITAAALKEGRLHVPKPEYADVADMENAWQFPAVSVVDYDSDGHDDLFLTARWGRCQMLRNKGDGTFEDTTFRAGLDVEHAVNCAIFADFDNDGDPDALLGRSIEPTLYFINEGGTSSNPRPVSQIWESSFWFPPSPPPT